MELVCKVEIHQLDRDGFTAQLELWNPTSGERLDSLGKEALSGCGDIQKPWLSVSLNLST